MGKFIITEEEKKHIKSLYEQTSNGQQNMVPSGYEFITLYNNGFNKLNTDYQGKWNQGFLIFGNNKIDLTSMPHPRTETPVKLRLEFAPTTQSELMDDGIVQFTDNGDFVKKHRTYNLNVYDNTNKKIIRFEPDNVKGTMKNFIFDSNGNKVEWDTYLKGVKQFRKQE
jgi:hypothetical protein